MRVVNQFLIQCNSQIFDCGCSCYSVVLFRKRSWVIGRRLLARLNRKMMNCVLTANDNQLNGEVPNISMQHWFTLIKNWKCLKRSFFSNFSATQHTITCTIITVRYNVRLRYPQFQEVYSQIYCSYITISFRVISDNLSVRRPSLFDIRFISARGWMDYIGNTCMRSYIEC